jgi:hypothetical protein
MNSGFQLGLFSDYRISLHKRKIILQRILKSSENLVPLGAVAYPGIMFGGGSTNSVEGRGQREWGSGGGSHYSGVPLNFQMSETRILIRLL